MLNSNFDLAMSVVALRQKYTSPIEHRRGMSRILTFRPRPGQDVSGFEVFFRNETAATFVDGIRFTFQCPAGSSAVEKFSNWTLLNADEHFGWLKDPAYATMVEEEQTLLPLYRKALTRIALAAYYASIIQRSRERILYR